MGTQTYLALDEPFLPSPVRTEPRLWLRRIRICAAPGETLRSLELGPGLNVVWAPDADPEDRVGTRIGHGAGKTLLCRLLRHALGEPDLTGPDDARALCASFPEGFVDAEVVVAGQPWAVRRRFDPKGGSEAVRGELDALDECETEPYDAFLDAARATLGESAASLSTTGEPWLAALAWMSRDQERRFGGPLRWRDRAATPSSKLARVANVERLRVIRSLLRLRGDDDVAAEQAVSALEHDERRRIRQLADCEREIAWLSCRVAKETDRDAAELVQQPLMLRALVGELEETLKRFEGADEPEAATLALREVLEAKVREESAARARRAMIQDVGEDDCGTCHAPAEAAYTAGRKRDATKAAARAIEKADAAIAKAAKAVERARAKLQRAEATDRKRRRSERQAWATAREQLSRGRELERLLARRTELSSGLEQTQKELTVARADRDRALKEHARQVGRVAEVYDFVVRRLAGQDVRGRFVVGATQLDAQIRFADGRPGTSPAMRVMETLALDLSAMVLAAEDRADLPGLWIHDSPREADLARSHYDALYRLAGWLEDATATPGFQYVVTTTTRPPSSVAFRTVRLGAARNEDLLLRRALR